MRTRQRYCSAPTWQFARPGCAPRRPRFVRLGCEALESRDVPANLILDFDGGQLSASAGYFIVAGSNNVVFEPFAADLARRTAAVGAQRVLELAAGTGVVTRCLRDALPSADITATEIIEELAEEIQIFGFVSICGQIGQQINGRLFIQIRKL